MEISIESPLNDEIRVLIAELNAHLLELSPPEFCSHLTVEQMAEPGVSVWVARQDGQAVACGALKRHTATVGEVKRMYTKPAFRGLGIGSQILAAIIEAARLDGLSELVLETGHRHPDAWALYEKAGFSRRGPVLDYPDTDYSVFYQKQISA